MEDQVTYLDSSAIVKRYIEEPGSDRVREVFLRAYSGSQTLAFSLWNVGEVLGVMDKARNLGRLGEEQYLTARRRFLTEVRRLVKLNVLIVVGVKPAVLRESWKLVEKYHIYEADALQISSARYSGSSQFLTGDMRLKEVASREGLKPVYLG